MSKEDIKKIIYIIIGVCLLFVIGYFFIYVLAGLIIVGIVLYIYYKFFMKNDKTYTSAKKSKKINNVVMDAEYKEK